MRYAIVFSVFGAYLLAGAALLGGWGWLLAWPALSYLIVAAGYLGLGPRVFGKRGDGRRSWWAFVLLMPYLTLTWVLWHIYRRWGNRPCCHEVAPGLWLGRRPLRHELPADVALIVDVTAEFSPARGVVGGREYLTVPTLDGTPSREAEVRAVLARLAEQDGTVFIHCAAGHGRSALVAAGVLLARGLASDAKQAEEMLRAVRPGVRLNREQRRLLKQLVSSGALADSPGTENAG